MCYSSDCSARRLGKKRWIKFNDNLVEECHLTDEVLQNECFGGEYKAKFYDVQGWWCLSVVPYSLLINWLDRSLQLVWNARE